jgi:hypothetical protein
MTSRAAVCAWLLAATALAAAPAAAQSMTGEVDMSAGASTEDVRAGSVQARLFGANAADWRFFGEVNWGDTGSDTSDAFSGAYPYDGSFRVTELFVEKTFRPRGYLLGMRGGRYRTPFGLSARGDHAYSGFTRAPLIRYGKDFALANTWFEGGLDVIAGRPALYAETSLAVPVDEGELRRRSGLDASIRVQGYYKSLIVGASRIASGRDRALGSFAAGRSIFNGVDGRWTSHGVQVRGEWIHGHPFDGVKTTGGYLDVSVHHRRLGPVMVVGRAERLDYAAGPFSLYEHRFTAGTRIRLPQCLSAQVNVIHQPTGLAQDRTTVMDAGLTCSVRK